MSFADILTLGQNALELGLISSLTVLALFLSYTMLNVCDLSTDGCFALGAAVGAVVALNGNTLSPYLSILAAMGAGVLSGLIVALLQTKLGINSLLSGIILNTGLYSICMFVMNGSAQLNMTRTTTVFSLMKDLLKNTPFKPYSALITTLFFTVIVIVFLSFFLRTRLGLAIRATGNNPDMVRSSSIDPHFTTIIGLCVSNAFSALSGCLMAQYNKVATADIGNGMVTTALASLLIGGVFISRGPIWARASGAVLGAFLFRLVYTIALRFHMPAYWLKAISAVIVVLAIAGPYMVRRIPEFKRRWQVSRAIGKEGR